MKAVLTIECETLEGLRHVVASLPSFATELVALTEQAVKIEEVKPSPDPVEIKPAAEKLEVSGKDKKKQVYTRVCQNPKCGESFNTSRPDKLYCSSKCYQAEWLRKKKLKERQ